MGSIFVRCVFRKSQGYYENPDHGDLKNLGIFWQPKRFTKIPGISRTFRKTFRKRVFHGKGTQKLRRCIYFCSTYFDSLISDNGRVYEGRFVTQPSRARCALLREKHRRHRFEPFSIFGRYCIPVKSLYIFKTKKILKKTNQVFG